MASEDRHVQLVASMKVAENEAKSGETLFLVQLVTAAALDENPRYTLRQVYDALLEAETWLLLDPLNLLPLLVPSAQDGASDMLQAIAREGNAKEIIISVQEALERLERTVNNGEEDGEKYAAQLTRLLVVCRESISRLQLRKRGPAETLRPILDHFGAAIETVSPRARGDDGRNLIYSVSTLIQAALPWLTRNTHADDPNNQIAVDLLSHLLYDTLANCATYIRASLAQRRFEAYNPRLVLQSKIHSDSERGEEVIQSALDVARALGATSQVLISPPLSLGKLILLAHEQPISLPTSIDYLQKLIPILTSSLQQNIALDESLALLLTILATSPDRLPQEIVDPLATLITPLASTHPHPPTRHIAFRILAGLLSHATPPIHLAHLSSLITDCPFPQMRVAAVGLVKEAFLNAITSTSGEPSPFKSTMLIRALGSTLFRPDPPELFTSPTHNSLRKFLESSEPARLTECLAFYYILLKRDTGNSSGIRDRDMLRTVEDGLLAPLRKALVVWLREPSSLEDPHALMPLASLETSLERVDAAVESLRLP